MSDQAPWGRNRRPVPPLVQGGQGRDAESVESSARYTAAYLAIAVLIVIAALFAR